MILEEVHHIQLQSAFLVLVKSVENSYSFRLTQNLTMIMMEILLTDPVDSSSNVRVSGLKNSNNARRDSWDVLNKTKNVLSHNSLESLANMTESQLNTDLSYNRPRGLDSETEYNTRYNKFELVEKRSTERRGSDDNSDRYKIYS